MVLIYRILTKFAFGISNSFEETWTFAKQNSSHIYHLTNSATIGISLSWMTSGLRRWPPVNIS